MVVVVVVVVVVEEKKKMLQCNGCGIVQTGMKVGHAIAL